MSCADWPATAVGGIHWWIAPAYRDLLLGPDGLRLADWLGDGRAQLIKQGPHRLVYRVELPDLCFYLKRNLIPDIKTWLRQLVRPSKARMELEHILSLRARDIPTVQPLALGEQQAFLGVGDSYLITRSLEGTRQLNAFMALDLTSNPAACGTGRAGELRRERVRRRLAVELGRLVARMHDVGVRHDDLHAANILVRLDADDRPELFLIDLNAVRAGVALAWPDCRANLVLLNRWFVPRSSRTDRLRFWRAYYQARLGNWQRGPAGPREHFLRARDIERHTWISSRTFWTNRDQRCLQSNRYFRKLRGPGIHGHAVLDLDGAELNRLLADPDEPFRQPGVRLLKDSRSSTVAELEMNVAGVSRRVVYKRFRVTTWTDPWVALLRRSPAVRSWFFGQALRERCLPTARPLAVLHRRRHGLSYEGYLLTEKIEGAQNLGDAVAEIARLPGADGRRVLRRRIDEVARVVRELHRWRYSHRDLKATNILVARASPEPETRFQPVAESTSGVIPNSLPWPATAVWLIDLVGIRSFARLPRRRKVQNLARLNASFSHSGALTRADRLRFLRIYLQWGLRGRDGWKAWWRAVAQATTAKVRRNVRIGRPLS